MPPPIATTQRGVVQDESLKSPNSPLPLSVSTAVAVPALYRPTDTLVRVLAVALNPTDVKMITHFTHPDPGSPIGCDFCGVVEDGGTDALARLPVGARVCGGLFPYGCREVRGAFAEWTVADAGLLLRVPDSWSDAEGAALGGVCWGACMLGLFLDAKALALSGRPSKPETVPKPVLVYGGATASGTMACQLLKRSGYSPIAVASTASAELVKSYGADATATYTSPACAEQVRKLAGTVHHALDCITSPESVAICFAALSRAGGRYACLEKIEDGWRTRRAVRTKEVFAFEATGQDIELGDSGYSRQADTELHERACRWVVEEMQPLLDSDGIKPHPVRRVEGKWQGILQGLEMVRRGEVRGCKIVITLASFET